MFRKVVRFIFILFFIILVIIFTVESYNNKIDKIIERVSLEPNKDWQRFAMSLKINFLSVIPLAKGDFSCGGLSQYEGNTVYPLQLKIQAIPPLSKIKAASADFFSYVDPKELMPYNFISCIKINGQIKEEKEIIYNQKEGYIVSGGERYKILPQTQDPLSLIFYLMKGDFSLHRTIDLNLNSNQANYRVKIEVKDRNKYCIQSKDYFVWELNLSVRRRKGDIMRHSLDAKVYFLELQDIKLPLLAKASTNLGGITLRLNNFWR